MNANELANEIEKDIHWIKDALARQWVVDMLRQQQAEIESLKAKYENDYAKAFENGYAIGLSHGKDMVNG